MCALGVLAGPKAAASTNYPGQDWQQVSPEAAGLRRTELDRVATYLGGRGMIVRHGQQVFAWGNVTKRADIASAAKPFYSHLLLRAVELGKLRSVEVPLAEFEPRLKSLNPELAYKDATLTFRHCANQISGYGVREPPGTAFDYNDHQMTLFWDTLFDGVYGSSPAQVDRQIFGPLLTEPLGCQDQPTMLAFGPGDRPGRVAISVRDHCRFGLLYLRQGRWPATDGSGMLQLLSPEHIRLATQSPLPVTLPRTRAEAAAMLPGQRSIGSRRIPDDQTDHLGCYSWLWWVNGTRTSGQRLWPEAPADAFAALGHEHGMRGLAVIPSLDLVLAWNDTTLDQKPWPDQVTNPHPLNEAFRLLGEAVRP